MELDKLIEVADIVRFWREVPTWCNNYDLLS